jgi:hypothetical protein
VNCDRELIAKRIRNRNDGKNTDEEKAEIKKQIQALKVDATMLSRKAQRVEAWAWDSRQAPLACHYAGS